MSNAQEQKKKTEEFGNKPSERPQQKLMAENFQEIMDSSFNMAEGSSKAKTTTYSLNLTII